MLNSIFSDAEERMHKAIHVLEAGLRKLRTGRAHPSILDHIKVEYYGNDTPLNQVGSITVTDARTLTVSPWERSMIPVIEKAIINANLGLNPTTAGDVIRIPMPALTEERRKDLARVVKSEAEDARVAIRNVRRDANNNIKELLKAKEISEDEQRKSEEHTQRLTDKYVKQVDEIMHKKEADLMAV